MLIRQTFEPFVKITLLKWKNLTVIEEYIYEIIYDMFVADLNMGKTIIIQKYLEQ